MYFECGPCAIRSWRLDDEKSLPTHANNRKIWLNLRDQFPHPYTSDDARRWVKHITKVKPEISFAIDVDGEAVGGIALVLGKDVERCSAEIGYWLGEEFWRRGIATAAVVALTDYAFQNLKLTRVFALPFARNDASVRVLEKADTCARVVYAAARSRME